MPSSWQSAVDGTAHLYSVCMAELKTSAGYAPTGDQPRAVAELARSLGARGALPDAAGRHRNRQDGDDGLDHRGDPAAGARDRAQQDARSAALQRVPRVLPAERRRVLRLLLRLLPARGVRPAGRPLHREGQLAERRHRPAAPRRDVEPALAPRRRHRRLGLVHLRPRLAGGVREARRLPDRRRGDGSRPDAAEADRHPVRPQRHAARPRPLPGQGRRGRDPAGVRGDGLPDLDVRRRGRADHALRPAHRRGLRQARHDHRLSGDAVRHLEADDRARLRRDQARARGAGRAVRVAGPTAGGAPDPPAHRIRPRDDARARLLQRDRELLADPRRPAAGLGAAHAARLLPVRLRRLRRRVAPDGAADRRHVRGRPLAQADARRPRLPAALGARQPAAPLRRVPREGAAARVRLGHAGPVRDAPLERDRRAADPPDVSSSTRRSSCARRRTRSTTC